MEHKPRKTKRPVRVNSPQRRKHIKLDCKSDAHKKFLEGVGQYLLHRMQFNQFLITCQPFRTHHIVIITNMTNNYDFKKNVISTPSSSWVCGWKRDPRQRGGLCGTSGRRIREAGCRASRHRPLTLVQNLAEEALDFVFS